MSSLGLSLPVLVVLAFLVLAVLVVLTWTGNQRRRSDMLRERFGPEYNHTVEEMGDRRKAEAELADRAKRVRSFDIHPLTAGEQSRFAGEWQTTRARFVDDPSSAVREADRLVQQVMEARGYPMGTFEQRAADISVDHPAVVSNYRSAHDLAMRNEHGQSSTEDLRQAMVYYRNLFNDLLEVSEVDKKEAMR